MVTLGTGARITFLDTPGHNAFTSMRERGVAVTDMVVLVVAADEGVLPQTQEAIDIALQAQIPIIVAINKCDKETAAPDKIRRQLVQHGLVLEDFGGEIQCVDVSALKRENLDRLIDAILLQAEMLDLRTDREGSAECVLLEAHVDKGRGIVATVLVRSGTLKLNSYFIAGTAWGKVRALLDHTGKPLLRAEPSTPVELIGFKDRTLPSPGDELIVLSHENQVRDLLEYRRQRHKIKELLAAASAGSSASPSDEGAGDASPPKKKTVNIVLRVDVGGSLEAVESALLQLRNEEVDVQIVRSGVGLVVLPSDIGLAKDTEASVLGFNVAIPNDILELARVEKVDVRSVDVIYQLLDLVKAKIEAALPPKQIEEVVGQGEVLSVFHVTMPNKVVKAVAGLRVVRGYLDRRLTVKVLRPTDEKPDGLPIFSGSVESLRKFKTDVNTVKKGEECGLACAKWDELRQGDLIQCIRIKDIPRKFSELRLLSTSS
jgi:translation initiation factor IF-2